MKYHLDDENYLTINKKMAGHMISEHHRFYLDRELPSRCFIDEETPSSVSLMFTSDPGTDDVERAVEVISRAIRESYKTRVREALKISADYLRTLVEAQEDDDDGSA